MDAGLEELRAIEARRRDLAVAGVCLAVAAVAIQSALYLADVYVLDRRVGTFDVDREGGLGGWASTVAIFSTALLALLFGVIHSARRMQLLVLAGAAAFLSFDEALMVHERIGLKATDALDVSDTYLRVSWPVLYLPLLGAVAATLFLLARASTHPARSLLIVGLGLLAAAVGLEIAWLAVDLIPSLTAHGWLYAMEIALEEGAELAGWIMLATGLAVLLLAPDSDVVAPHRAEHAVPGAGAAGG